MKKIAFLITVAGVSLLSCSEPKKQQTAAELNSIAVEYVKLGLQIGLYDTDFVDAYYGPDSLKPATTKQQVFPKDHFLAAIKELQTKLSTFKSGNEKDTLNMRATWISQQLNAFQRRVNIFAGNRKTFDEESKDLFGVVAPSFPENYFQKRVSNLDSLLPGTGSIADRFQNLANHFIIPKNKIDTVFKTAIAESRKRTLAHFKLPENENFTLAYVTNKPWSGYNWYKGNYQSDIQINTDQDIFIERAIDVASHESYPGHHVYNMLLEKNLYHDKGWVEISLYPLFSPQSLIAEGSANYGIDLAFPGESKNEFARNILLPLAGLDTTGIEIYFKALALKAELNFVRNEVGRGLINNTMSESEALRWLMDYNLANRESALKSISFIRKYGSYVINYNYGQLLVKEYIESKPGAINDQVKRWDAFGQLLSNPITPADLLKKK